MAIQYETIKKIHNQNFLIKIFLFFGSWRAREDSNSRPLDCSLVLYPAELRARY